MAGSSQPPARITMNQNKKVDKYLFLWPKVSFGLQTTYQIYYDHLWYLIVQTRLYPIEVHFAKKSLISILIWIWILAESGLQSDMVSMLLTFLQLSHENLCILVKPMCYFLKRPTAVLLETRTHVPAIIVIRLFVDKLVPSIMSFSHGNSSRTPTGILGEFRLEKYQASHFTTRNLKSETSDLLFSTSLLIHENSISSSWYFRFGSQCAPKYPMAGTSATIFEWEDSGNGFLRGGHRSLRFPSDTAHSFAQWGQCRFEVAF